MAGPWERLSALLRPLPHLTVLLSGGVDSGLLAAAAAHTLGPERVLALTLASQLSPEEDTGAARALAFQLGVRHLVLPFDALSLSEVAANSPRRCYACKREVIRLAQEAARREGFDLLAEGSNAEDMDEYVRPGLAAVREAGVLSPLAGAGLTKVAVRELARRLGLSVWERPSSPCLATRFPVGHMLAEAELALVSRGEQLLRGELGLRVVRLRWEGGGVVRLEVGAGELEAARTRAAAIASRLSALGLALAGPPLPYGPK